MTVQVGEYHVTRQPGPTAVMYPVIIGNTYCHTRLTDDTRNHYNRLGYDGAASVVTLWEAGCRVAAVVVEVVVVVVSNLDVRFLRTAGHYDYSPARVGD